MTTGPTATFARLHEGLYPISQSVELELVGDQLRVDERLFAVAEVEVSPRAGSADRFISLPNGWELQVPDAPWLDLLPTPEQGAKFLPWLEARSWVAATSLLGIVGFAGWFWFAGLPYVAAFGARHVPFALELRLGQESLTNLDASRIFEPTKVDEALEHQLAGRFNALVSALKDGQSYQLVLRDASIGANAIALPGNLVVVTDDLVNLCSIDEVGAVMAHELAHASQRHVMRSYLAEMSLETLGALLWGRGSSTSVALDTVPLSLLELSYSRELEQRADDGAFELLRRIGQSPTLVADALERMSNPDFVSDADRAELARAEAELAASGGAGAEDDEPTGGDAAAENDDDAAGAGSLPPTAVPADDEEPARQEPWSFLSTHPITSERIARARAQR